MSPTQVQNLEAGMPVCHQAHCNAPGTHQDELGFWCRFHASRESRLCSCGWGGLHLHGGPECRQHIPSQTTG